MQELRYLTESRGAMVSGGKEHDYSGVLATVVDTVPQLLSYVDSSLRYRYVNPQYAQWFGLTQDEFTGRKVEEVLGDKMSSIVLPKLKEALTGTTVTFSQWRTSGAKERFMEASYVPDFDAQGNVRGLVASVRDISERHLREVELECEHRARATARTAELAKALADQRNMAASFRSLIESSVDCMVVNRHGTISYLNPTTLTCLGYDSASELLGQPIASIIPEDLRVHIAEVHAQLEKTGRTPIGPGRFLCRDGTEIEVEVLAIPIVFDGEPAVLTVARDTRERAEFLTRLMQMDRMVSLGTLAAGVGHEINNPLTFVLGNLDFVQQELSQCFLRRPELLEEFAEVSEALEEAHTGASRAAAVVAELRSLTRVSETKAEPIHIASLLRTATRMAGNELRHRAQLVVDVIEDEKLPLVWAVESRLSQVFLNLLLNAAQAIDVGNAHDDTVSLRTRVEPEHLVIEVADTGHGITDDAMSRIFEPFFTTKDVGSGTGLGLSICREIVREHQGSIEVTSVVGEGTTFTVRLPLAAATTAAEQAEPLTPPTRQARVLIIDDEELVAKTLARLLADSNEVEPVLDARLALERIRGGERYDAIFCDLMLPEMTGMEFFTLLEDEYPEQAACVIFMTGGAFSDDARKFAERMSERCERKPIRLDRLRQLVAMVTN